jgi:hypothetical protein
MARFGIDPEVAFFVGDGELFSVPCAAAESDVARNNAINK